MKKINVNGYLKNVAISTNTVYNLIGNFDSEKNQIFFKETDGTEVFLSFQKERLFLTRTTRESTMRLEFVPFQETICAYETLGFPLEIKIYTEEYQCQENKVYVRYRVEEQEICEYQLTWEVIYEFDSAETENQK